MKIEKLKELKNILNVIVENLDFLFAENIINFIMVIKKNIKEVIYLIMNLFMLEFHMIITKLLKFELF